MIDLKEIAETTANLMEQDNGETFLSKYLKDRKDEDVLAIIKEFKSQLNDSDLYIKTKSYLNSIKEI